MAFAVCGRLFHGLRVAPPRLLAISSPSTVLYKRYASTAAQTATTAAKIPSRGAPKASPSKADGTGNPDIMETLPTTANEVDIDVESDPTAPEPPIPAAAAPSPTPSWSPAPGSSPYPDGMTSSDAADGRPLDWSKSYHGLSSQPFDREIAEVLLAPIDPEDVEIKPDGLLYLPEIKYRRILNKAFGPGGWGLAPRSETNVSPKIVSREYALVCLGRLVGIARGEQEYFDPSGIATATEACKSNALMRCCKDLGIASELWDPRFIREYKAKYCSEVFVTHMLTQRKKKMWRRKDAKFEYPFKE